MSEEENLTCETAKADSLKAIEMYLQGMDGEPKNVYTELAAPDRHMTGFMLRAEGQAVGIRATKERLEYLERRLALTK